MALTSDAAGFVAAVRRLAASPEAPAAAGSQPTANADPARAAVARAFAAEHKWARRAEALAAAAGLPVPSREPDPAQVR